MKSASVVYVALLQGLPKAVEQSIKDVFKGFQVLMCELLYSSCLSTALCKLEDERICHNNMSRLLEMHSAVMNLGVHEYLLYSALGFIACNAMLEGGLEGFAR